MPKRLGYIIVFTVFSPLMPMNQNSLTLKEIRCAIRSLPISVKPISLKALVVQQDSLSRPVVTSEFLSAKDTRRGLALICLAASNKKTQEEYANKWFPTSEGQTVFLRDMREGLVLNSLRRFRESERIVDFSNERKCRLMNEKERYVSAIDCRKKYEKNKESGCLFFLSETQERFFVMNDSQRQVVTKMYTHFNNPKETIIDLSTAEWVEVQGLPKNIKREFRTLDDFLKARRIPTQKEEAYRFLGTVGTLVCCGLIGGSPMAVIAKFCGGVFSAFLLETELLDIKITDSIIKSFNNTMQHAVVKNDKMDIAAFQEAEDLAIKQFINTGKDFFSQYSDNLKTDIISTAKTEGSNILYLEAKRSLDPVGIVTSPQVLRSIAGLALVGVISGLFSINEPCEEKNISQID